MGLNHTKTVPNSTDVWWEVSENANKYNYLPTCKIKQLNLSEIRLTFLCIFRLIF